MLVKQFSIVLYFLTKALYASKLFPHDLDSQLSRLSLENASSPQLSLPLYEIFEQGSKLMEILSNYSVEAGVERIEREIAKMLTLGFALVDIAPIIGSLEIDAKELVLAAVKKEAHILLKILQMVYIWSDEAQFHWFKALSYLSPWYDEKMWENSTPFPMNWRRNLRAICEWDNDALVMAIQSEILSKEAWNSFSGELLALCAEYDAIKVFTATKMEPVQLEKYLELMSIKSSASLLRLYQAFTRVDNLHLERFLPPEQLPVSVDDFEFLMRHGHDCYSMNQFIERSCENGRLDLLKYLHKSHYALTPGSLYLDLVAEKGWLHILIWAHQLGQIDKRNSEELAIKLTVYRHFQALELWMDINNLVFDGHMIRMIIEAGALEALLWINEKHQISQGQQEWSDLAAKHCHLPILKWLYDKFEIFPSVESLVNTSVEISKKTISVGITWAGESLGHYMAVNYEFLQWIVENAPPSFFNKDKEVLSKIVCTRTAMKWLYKKLKICPLLMDWAYETGDLGAIKWAMRKRQILPTRDNISHAARRGHFHIIEWIYESHPEYLLYVYEVLKNAVRFGNLDIANYLLPKLTVNRKKFVELSNEICAGRHLDTLKWIYEHSFRINMYNELHRATKRGDLPTVKWLVKTFPTIPFDSYVWYSSVIHGCHEIYRWLLKRHSKSHQRTALQRDINTAYQGGDLEIIKLILVKDPTLAKEMPISNVTISNYHIKQWLVSNGFVLL